MRKIFFACIYSFVGWAKAPLRRAHHNKAQSLRREVGGHAIGRAFARPMALPTLRSTLHRAPDMRALTPAVRRASSEFGNRLGGIEALRAGLGAVVSRDCHTLCFSRFQ